jgi:hypothetical protein
MDFSCVYILPFGSVLFFHKSIQNESGTILTITDLCINGSLFRNVDTIQELSDILVLNQDGLVNKSA